MKDFFGREMPILDGTAYEKVCIAVECGEISEYISNAKYQTLYPGDKNFPMFVLYDDMLKGLLQYLDEYPEKEALFAETFIEEIKTAPGVCALVTLIEMLRYHKDVFDKKRFFTDELVTEMANQIEIKSHMLENFLVPGLGYEYRRENLQFIDRFVYKAYGIHLVKP